MSVIFTWKENDFEYLVKSCDKGDNAPYMLKYLPKSGKIVEAGCGLGRYVKYLSEKGYDVEGIEYNGETVRVVREKDASLKVIQGDVLNMPYQANSIGGIISLGVIEHFIPGPFEVLKEMYRALKPGGIAIISVPSLNLIRRIKRYLYINEIGYYVNPINILRRSNIVRKLLKKQPVDKTKKIAYNRGKNYPYAIYPTFGDFFEYRFSKKQFEDFLVKSGFTIIESVPIGHMDGIYHEFGRLFTTFKNWEFHPNILGKVLNSLLSKKSFCHNHMHLCVVRKD